MNPLLFDSPLGKSLLAAERELLGPVMEGVFGEVFVQIGNWGGPEHFAALARTQRTLVAGANGDLDSAVWVDSERLPFLTDSVDVALLPHTLDYCRQPHATLREVSRVLRSDGQLIILGFKPGGLWGLRRLAPGTHCPAKAQRLIPQRSLTDWLELLDLRILERQRYFFRLPRLGAGQPVSETWERRGERWWPELAACYMVRAQKRLSTLTPIRQRWRPAPKVVAGLVKPSARASGPKLAGRRIIETTPSRWRRR